LPTWLHRRKIAGDQAFSIGQLHADLDKFAFSLDGSDGDRLRPERGQVPLR
jgi:hypothetical protein